MFSREFIVGYYAPAFFTTILLAYAVDGVPARFGAAGGADQVLLVGGAALLLALLLNGVRHPVTSIYSGARPIDVLPLATAAVEYTPSQTRPTRRIARWMTPRL